MESIAPYLCSAKTSTDFIDSATPLLFGPPLVILTEAPPLKSSNPLWLVTPNPHRPLIGEVAVVSLWLVGSMTEESFDPPLWLPVGPMAQSGVAVTSGRSHMGSLPLAESTSNKSTVCPWSRCVKLVYRSVARERTHRDSSVTNTTPPHHSHTRRTRKLYEKRRPICFSVRGPPCYLDPLPPCGPSVCSQRVSSAVPSKSPLGKHIPQVLSVSPDSKLFCLAPQQPNNICLPETNLNIFFFFFNAILPSPENWSQMSH